MIIARINGGLGNQLYQYAAARKLACKHNTILKLDISDLVNAVGYHIYGLRHFNIIDNFATTADIIRYYPAEGFKRLGAKIPGNKLTSLIYGKVANLVFKKILKDKSEHLKRRYSNYDPHSKIVVPLIVGRVLSQRFFHFDPEILDAPDDVYMTGSFISEKYFKDIKELIHKELSFKTEQSVEDKEVNEMIRNVESISIHIRRGEVVEEAQNQTTYNFINNDYYNSCIDFITRKITNPYFFIFSDDIEWVKNNFKVSFPAYYVAHNYDSIDYRINSGTDFQDMRLMSQCKHNIITNSTFSWWAAWLNRNPNKIVCSPKEFVRIWNFDNKDIVPDDWIKF